MAHALEQPAPDGRPVRCQCCGGREYVPDPKGREPMQCTVGGHDPACVRLNCVACAGPRWFHWNFHVDTVSAVRPPSGAG